MGLQLGPEGLLPGIGEEVLDYGAAGRRLFQGKQRLAGDPAVLHGLLPGGGVFALANDDPEPVNGNRVVLEHFLGLAKGEFLPGDDLFVDPAEIDERHMKSSSYWKYG